jgi:hypothetical protein
MDRRDFLKRMSAAAATFTAFAAASKPAEASSDVIATYDLRTGSPPPKCAITADTTGFCKSIADAQRLVEEKLKECRVVSASIVGSTAGCTRLDVSYASAAPDAPYTPLDDQVTSMLVGEAKMVSVSVAQVYDDPIDVCHIGTSWSRLQAERSPRYEIEVSWMVVPRE